MLALVAYALLFAVVATFAIGVRVAPRVVARLAFVPVRRRVAIPLPPRAAVVVTPSIEAGDRYREPPKRALMLAALFGVPRIERGDQIIWFEPALRCVFTYRKLSPAELTCVDVSLGVAELILRARRFPVTELWFAALVLAGIEWSSGLRQRPLWLFLIVGIVGGVAAAVRRREARGFEAVVAEIEARIALANGDAPPSPPPSGPTASRFTGPDEWTCACGEVNARKRGTCRRCWSQRPRG